MPLLEGLNQHSEVLDLEPDQPFIIEVHGRIRVFRSFLMRKDGFAGPAHPTDEKDIGPAQQALAVVNPVTNDLPAFRQRLVKGFLLVGDANILFSGADSTFATRRLLDAALGYATLVTSPHTWEEAVRNSGQVTRSTSERCTARVLDGCASCRTEWMWTC